jgi:hypothetical protein
VCSSDLHKIQRGYLPIETYSAHWIRDPGFREAVERFVERERDMLHHEAAAIGEIGPYRNDEGGGAGGP